MESSNKYLKAENKGLKKKLAVAELELIILKDLLKKLQSLSDKIKLVKSYIDIGYWILQIICSKGL